MRWLMTIILLLVLVLLHVVTLEKTAGEKLYLPKDEGVAYTLPSQILRITSLGYDSIVSDLLFIQASVFVGASMERKETPKIKGSEWKWLYNLIDAATDLDPYFSDPYYFASSHLVWNGGMIREANAVLEKGGHFRTWDPLIPYYIGFNYFYFLRDNEKASEWLMTAARKPGASTAYASLAAKLAYKERKTENSISFLEEIIRTTEDESLRKDFAIRVKALSAILVLEQALSVYKKKFGITPKRLDALVQKRVLPELPRDPYGGTFYLDTSDNVRSTTESKLLPAQH